MSSTCLPLITESWDFRELGGKGHPGKPQKIGVLKPSDLSRFVLQRAELGEKQVSWSNALSTLLQTFLWPLVGSAPISYHDPQNAPHPACFRARGAQREEESGCFLKCLQHLQASQCPPGAGAQNSPRFPTQL